MIDLPTLSVALPLVVICALAFSIETALGFGATLISVALGSFVLDLDVLLPAMREGREAAPDLMNAHVVHLAHGYDVFATLVNSWYHTSSPVVVS